MHTVYRDQKVVFIKISGVQINLYYSRIRNNPICKKKGLKVYKFSILMSCGQYIGVDIYGENNCFAANIISDEISVSNISDSAHGFKNI